jgi:hypothetical protein
LSSLVLMLRPASSFQGDVSAYPAIETVEYTRVLEAHGSKIERGYDRVQHSRRHSESVPRFHSLVAVEQEQDQDHSFRRYDQLSLNRARRRNT